MSQLGRLLRVEMPDPPAIETAQAGVSAERTFLVFT